MADYASATAPLTDLLSNPVGHVIASDMHPSQAPVSKRRFSWEMLAAPLAAVPLAVAAVLTFLHTPTNLTARITALSEALLIGASTLLTSWILVLGPLVDATEGTLLERSIGLAYPVGDVVLTALVIFVATHSRRVTRRMLLFIGIGLVGLTLSDSTFVITTFNGTYRSGSLVDVGWLLGFLFIGFGARRPEDAAEDLPATTSRMMWLSRLTLFGPVSIAFVIHA